MGEWGAGGSGEVAAEGGNNPSHAIMLFTCGLAPASSLLSLFATYSAHAEGFPSFIPRCKAHDDLQGPVWTAVSEECCLLLEIIQLRGLRQLLLRMYSVQDCSVNDAQRYCQ